ncbi:hypothetical protein F4823DRAFT_568935 [Ustulina deusta]|nr:hypothetical protein F4823DRAFT_568935 [Ustulina deusta]
MGIFKQLELLDITVPVAMYQEYKLRTLWTLTTTTALLFASLFTTFSAALFQELNLPTTIPLMLQPSRSFVLPTDSFLDYDYMGSSAQIPSLILEGNYSFPRFTYMDLAFPELTTLTTVPSTLSGSTVSISAVIPAVRGRMDYVSYEPNQIHVNITTNDDTLHNKNNLAVWIDGQGIPQLHDFDLHPHSNATYIGSSYSKTLGNHVLYFWAKMDHGAEPALQHAGALSCNLTFEALDVNTTFINTAFDLDSHNPPQPLENTVRDTAVNHWKLHYDDFSHLATIDVDPQFMDPFFTMLVTFQWAISISALGDPSANGDVIDAIQLHSRIILAQTLTAIRGPANETNATLAEPIGPGDNDAQRIINATATNTRRRVVQDVASTHILVALLATTLILFVIGWATSPRTDVLPRSPTTIASAVALLAGGNIFDRLPPDTPLLSPEESASALGGPETRFWMGWGNLVDKEGRQNGGENEGGVSQFGIFVVDKDNMGILDMNTKTAAY